ncbi:L,D-transpeptidase family protein [Hymenobacter sp. UYCo722]|uniref:L,D-transpeptidase family protein n=1 Tax=Hymenobacter sp. UYCo722 TaxID=3156335 RepID=UPI00339B4E78
MLRRLSCYLLLLFPGCPLLAQSCTVPAPVDSSAAFWRQQLRFPRVRAAQATAGPVVAARLRARSLDSNRLEVLFRLLKTHRELEVWARNRDGGGPFELLHAYPLAATSGTLGPKRRAGDGQVPEGFYEIDRFNPSSNFHLSLGLNYPTAAERARGEPDPGGDIFIHGGKVTIGCLPITDAGIEEVYLLAVLARAAGQQSIPVHIFPFPITNEELAKRAGSPHLAYWRELQPGYAYFEKTHKVTGPGTVAAQ